MANLHPSAPEIVECTGNNPIALAAAQDFHCPAGHLADPAPVERTVLGSNKADRCGDLKSRLQRPRILARQFPVRMAQVEKFKPKMLHAPRGIQSIALHREEQIKGRSFNLRR